MLGKQPQFNHSRSKIYLNSCSRALITDARPRIWPLPAAVARVMAIVHAASSPTLCGAFSDTCSGFGEGWEREAIVLNHPRGEICLENHLCVIDDSRGFLLTSLSGSSDTFFRERTLRDEISEL